MSKQVRDEHVRSAERTAVLYHVNAEVDAAGRHTLVLAGVDTARGASRAAQVDGLLVHAVDYTAYRRKRHGLAFSARRLS